MACKMTHEMRSELADAIRRRYRSAKGPEKRRILGEFIATTGYHEKSPIRVLNAHPHPSAARLANARRSMTRRRVLPLSYCGRHPTAFAASG